MPDGFIAMDVLWNRLAKEEPRAVCGRAAVEFDPAGPAYLVPLCGQTLRVLPTERRVEAPDGRAGYEASLACVQYLLTARDEPPARDLVNPRTLPDGDFFFRGPHEMPEADVALAFGSSVEAFRRAAEALGGRRLAGGDAGYEFAALPRVRAAVLLWTADDEFPARGQVLVDGAAHRQLPLDALWCLCRVLVKRLIAAAR